MVAFVFDGWNTAIHDLMLSALNSNRESVWYSAPLGNGRKFPEELRQGWKCLDRLLGDLTDLVGCPWIVAVYDDKSESNPNLVHRSHDNVLTLRVPDADTTIVEIVNDCRHDYDTVIVVTDDRALRLRCMNAGATMVVRSLFFVWKMFAEERGIRLKEYYERQANQQWTEMLHLINSS